MTAVASPPSLQQLPRWDLGKDGADGLDAMTSEEVSRILMPQKTAPRPAAATSPNTTSTVPPSQSAPRRSNLPQSDHSSIQGNGDNTLSNNDDSAWNTRSKVAKFWPNSKADSVIGLTTGRGQPHSTTPSSGQSAASAINSALQQQSAMTSQPQTNGIKPDATQQAILALHPLTGTFERKHILVPFFPELQKIGRQTNQKTVPAANNGYFDSKVLSRSHAEIWAERNGKIWIRDVKSSNGTFVNGLRLSLENKESEPHELHEGDTLELGIDIVSEDQKSIVHHKVSAKVELAGLYSNAANMLDMMHIDPNTGQPILADPISQQHGQLRGRGTSQGSVGSVARGGANIAVGANMLGPQRHVNMWMGPITIEQVVKKLTTELKQAKQQSHELHRTQDFFTSLLQSESGQEPPKSPLKRKNLHHQQNGGSPVPTDYNHMYQPPAPPPSQPLPDKPDAAGIALADSLLNPGLRRSETEKPQFPSNNISKAGHQDSQILSLLEALTKARQELSTQGDRMKSLETALDRERKAREMAERKAQALSGDRSLRLPDDTDEMQDAFEPPLDSLELIEKDLPNGRLEEPSSEDAYSPLNSSSSMETLKDQFSVEPAPFNDPDVLKGRYELLKQEFDQMKMTMEAYKRKAEEAEESQRRFADLVESARSDRRSTGQKSAPPPDSNQVYSNDSTLIGSDGRPEDPTVQNHGSPDAHDATSKGWSLSWKRDKSTSHLMNGSANGAPKLPHELERSLTRVIEAQRLIEQHEGGGKFLQTTPYVSMVGVVLIGVGLMTWLNGWTPPHSGGGKLAE